MGKSNPDIQVPGAPAPSPAAAAPAETSSAAQASQGEAGAGRTDGANPGPDARDAEIAALRAQLAAEQAKNAPAGSALVMEADGPNTRRYRAESRHLHLTSTELDGMVRRGEVKLTEHHVLCKDGWYVNPEADKRDRQG